MMALGQQDLLPAQKRFRVGVFFDQANTQFGVNYLSVKKKKYKIKYDLGVKIFNLKDEHMQYDKIKNIYVAQRVYHVSSISCSLCWIFGGSASFTYARDDDKILIGSLVNTYDGFYPKLAIPLSQTFYLNHDFNRRIKPVLGAGWMVTYTHGLRVVSREYEIEEIDNTLRSEIFRMEQVVTTNNYSALVVGVLVDFGLELYIASDYYVAAGIVAGGNVNSVKSNVEYISLGKSFYQVKFSVSKDF